MKSVRPPWLIFGLLLACAVIGFSVTTDWSTQSWLDLAAYVVSVVGIAGVLAYATSLAFGGVFWGRFRWVFVAVVSAQTLVHTIGTAKRHGYSSAQTAVLIFVVTVIMGLVFALQWIAMTRLAREQ